MAMNTLWAGESCRDLNIGVQLVFAGCGDAVVGLLAMHLAMAAGSCSLNSHQDGPGKLIGRHVLCAGLPWPFSWREIRDSFLHFLFCRLCQDSGDSVNT